MGSRENWKRALGLSGYEVSDLGRVWSLHRERVMKTRVGVNGYEMLTLRKEGRKVCRTVHSLVLEAFRGRRPAGSWASHLDSDSLNNRLENLVWESRSANQQRKHENGTAGRGGPKPWWDLRDLDSMKAMRGRGMSYRKIAKEKGCSPWSVRNALLRD